MKNIFCLRLFIVLILCFVLAHKAIHAQSSHQLTQVADIARQDTAYPFNYVDYPIFTGLNRVWFQGGVTNTAWASTGVWTYDGSIPYLRYEYDELGYHVDFSDSACITATAWGINQIALIRYGLGDRESTILDIFEADNPFEYNDFVVFNNKVIYKKNSPEGVGKSLWVVHENDPIPQPLPDVWPGQNDNPRILKKAIDFVYYTQISAGNINLWRTDGTPEGATQITFGYNPWLLNIDRSSAQTIGNRLFVYSGIYSNPPVLYTSTGATETTDTVAVFEPETGAYFRKAATVGENYLFTINQPDVGNEWWSIDTSTLTPQLLFDIATGEEHMFAQWNPYTNPVLDDHFYFLTNGELWRTDGSPENTAKVTEVPLSMTLLGAGSSILYMLNATATNVVEVWRSDGTALGTELVQTIHRHGYIPPEGAPCGIVNNTAIFDLNSNDESTSQLYQTNGTEEGTRPIGGQSPDYFNRSNPNRFCDLSNGDIFFRARDSNIKMWRFSSNHPPPLTSLSGQVTWGPYDAGEVIYWSGQPGSIETLNSSGISNVVPAPFLYNNIVPAYNELFLVNDNTITRINEDTMMAIYNLPDGHINGYSGNSDKIFFTSRIYNFFGDIFQLHQFDLNSFEDSIITQVENDIPIKFVPNGTVDHIAAYFAFSNGLTYLFIENLYLYSFPTVVDNIYSIKVLPDSSLLLLSQSATSNQPALFKYENGSLMLCGEWVKILDMNPNSYTDRLIGFPNGAVVFGAGDTDDIELWTSAGTPETTTLLKVINPNGSSSPDNWTPYNDSIWLFTAFDGLGAAWWKTNGTPEGTQKLIDLPAINYPATGLTAVSDAALLQGNRLFFSMDDGLTGAEPWVVLLLDSLVTPALLLPENDMTVRVFPNPAVDFFTVECEGEFGPTATLQIFDAQGQPVSSPLTPDQYEGDSSRWRVERPLRAGLYYAVVQAGRYRSVAKVMRVK